MIKPIQNAKLVAVTPPAAKVDDASFVTAEIDTIGFDHATIVVHLGDTDVAMSALKVTQSDTSGSGFVDIDGLTYGTSTDIDGNTSSLPTETDDNGFFVFDIDMRGKKRFLDVVATAGNGSTGTFATIFALLSQAEETPTTISELGATSILRA